MLRNLKMLKKAQIMLELNQRELGTYIGVSQRTINNWMTETRAVPAYVAEMTLRLADLDMKALDAGEPTSEMFRWAVISSRGIDEWIDVYGSKADALREAEADWKHLTPTEQKSMERFMVGLIHVCYHPSHDGKFDWIELSNGEIDGDVYECAKDYLEK